ncbi:MAG: nicotinamide riboside transporter PnuC [Lentisphaerota bacterium]
MLEFIRNNLLEIFGVVMSIVYLYFSINRNILLWVMGIISSSAYIIIFYKDCLYADAIQNLYYVLVSIYGFATWYMNRNSIGKSVFNTDVCVMTPKDTTRYICIWLTLFVVIYCLVRYLPDVLNITTASIPLVDSILTSAALVATWMMTKRLLEQCAVWIVIDFAYIVVYAYKGLLLTAFLFVIYTIMAVIMFIQWRKQYKLQLQRTKMR